MKVLITGGAGFIGSHTADRLLKEGYEVRVLDSLQKPIHNSIPEYLDERIEFMAGSATDVRALTEALQGVDYVYHLAAFQDYLEYSDAMKNLMNNKNYYVVCKLNAEKRYREIYDVPSIISKFVELYQEAANKK